MPSGLGFWRWCGQLRDNPVENEGIAPHGQGKSSAVVTTFTGVFPMDEPRYVIVAMLDDPKPTADTYGFHTAGWNVAPVVSGTVSRIAPMLGIAPDKGREPNMAEVLPFIHDTHPEE